MDALMISLSDNFILLGIIIVAVLIVVLTVWIIIANKKKKEEAFLPKKKVETIEEIMNEPIKPPAEDKSAIQSLLDEMAKDLETKEQDDVATFEQEQEEKAIISYQELLKTKNSPTSAVEIPTPVVNNQVEIIDIDTNPIIEEKAVPIMQEEPIEEVMVKEPLDDTRRFRTTEFISPVFGRSDTNVEYRTVDRSQIMAKFTTKDSKPVVKSEPVRPTNIISKPVVSETTPRPVTNNIPSKPVVRETPVVREVPSRLSRLETVKPEYDEILDVSDLETTIKTVANKDEVKKNDEFLKSLIAFRKNLE